MINIRETFAKNNNSLSFWERVVKKDLQYAKSWVRAGGLILLYAILVNPVFAEGFKLPDYAGYVNDFGGVIDAATRGKLENLCKTLEQKTSTELAIVTVKTVAPLDSKEYAVKLFEKWKIGKRGKDNGILMLLAMEEKRVEIEVGYGLEGIINDAKAGKILDRYVVPFFREGKFGEGLYDGAEALALTIAASSGQEMGEGQKGDLDKRRDGYSIILMVVAAVLMVVLSIFASGAASGVIGALMGAVFGAAFAGIIGAIIGAILGFVLSFTRWQDAGSFGGWGGGWGGGGFGGGGGGFGGFGGGGSGGGGSGRSW